MLESELFGYESGAFSGASKAGKPGLFEMAENGTILLDEISEMPLNLQAKLLQVLQSKKVIRLGGVKSVELNAQVLAATNMDLDPMVAAKQFRQDLYYRLNVIPIKIPALRERREDIIPLTLHFLQKFNKKHQLRRILLPDTLRLFHDYFWPGNVRELENLIERVVVTTSEEKVSENNELIYHLLKKNLKNPANGSSLVQVNGLAPLKVMKSLFEEQLIHRAFEELGSIKEVTVYLQADYSTIFRKAKKYHLIGEDNKSIHHHPDKSGSV